MILTGIKDVINFNETEIRGLTDIDEIVIKGYDLHITNLNLESGDLSIEGQITNFYYVEGKSNNGGFFARLFK